MARIKRLLNLACIAYAALLAALPVGAEELPRPFAGDSNAPPQSPSALSSPASERSSPSEAATPAISGNLAAVNIVTGTGRLGRALGFDPDSGVRIGGVWVGNANYLLAGGEKPGQASYNSLLVTDLNLDFARLAGVPGGQFDAQFLQFNGQPTNTQAGTVTGFNGLVGQAPLVRSELYQLWWRQSLFEEKLVVRVGKSVPTYDFNNVARPVRTRDESLMIPAVTGLIYTPVFKNPTLIGAMPGYYNSAYGITTTLAPNDRLYLSYGAYDGSGVERQTGLSAAPRFDGHYFHIAEAGYAWVLGEGTLPGGIAAGGWHQTGKLKGPDNIAEDGTSGFYTFGSQRLWDQHPGVDPSGISGFYQFGINDSRTLIASRYFGIGATGFGLIPGRPADTIGIGLAWSRLNRAYGFRDTEAILAVYYQAKLVDDIFAQPVLTYVPNPGATPRHKPVTAVTVQTTILF
jgi:porin